MIEHLFSQPLDRDEFDHVCHAFVEMDERFCRAMIAAIRAGLEHPPMIGIDHRPGTRKPLPLANHRRTA